LVLVSVAIPIQNGHYSQELSGPWNGNQTQTETGYKSHPGTNPRGKDCGSNRSRGPRRPQQV